MADYVSKGSSTIESNLVSADSVDFYTLEMANLANSIVEEDQEECVDWTMFGVGGPA